MAQQRLELKQQQKLSLSMQTIIHLLSLDYESLAEYMAKAVEENPALEYVPPVKSPMELTRFYSRTIKAPADYDWRTNIPNPVNPLMSALKSNCAFPFTMKTPSELALIFFILLIGAAILLKNPKKWPMI